MDRKQKKFAQKVNQKYKKLISLDVVQTDEFTRESYNILDMISDEISKPMATCKGKGCNYCCTNSIIGISFIEYQFIAENVSKEHLKENIPKVHNSLLWQLHMEILDPNTLGDCPFLKDGGCSIYPYRPIACRTFFSIDDVNLCKEGEPHKLINSSSNEMTNKINEMFQELSMAEVVDHSVLEIRDFFK